MSRGLHRGNNREQDVKLCDPLQRTCVEQLDGDTGYLRQESDKCYQHEQSVKPSESNSFTNDAGNSTAATRSTINGHTSYPCAHCNDYDPRNNASTNNTTSTKRQGISARLWDSIKPRYFKQTNADSADPIERCTGIPAGVTV